MKSLTLKSLPQRVKDRGGMSLSLVVVNGLSVHLVVTAGGLDVQVGKGGESIRWPLTWADVGARAQWLMTPDPRAALLEAGKQRPAPPDLPKTPLQPPRPWPKPGRPESGEIPS